MVDREDRLERDAMSRQRRILWHHEVDSERQIDSFTLEEKRVVSWIARRVEIRIGTLDPAPVLPVDAGRYRELVVEQVRCPAAPLEAVPYREALAVRAQGQRVLFNWNPTEANSF